jgi:uncharacterized heparinase superfamily protein
MSEQGRQASGVSGFTSVLDAIRSIGRRSTGSLSGRVPDRLLHTPLDLVPGDAARGNALLGSLYNFGGQIVRAAETGDHGDGIPWEHDGAGDFWLAEMQGFGWLRDLRAVGTEAAHKRARSMVLDWLDNHGTIERATAWRAQHVGQRLCAWLAHSEFLLRSADHDFTQRFYQALDMHARHLVRIARGAESGAPQLLACKGLIYGGLCLPDGERRVAQGLKLLDSALAEQVLPDGGHVERAPSIHLAVMRHLSELHAALDGAGHQDIPALSGAITRLARVLRMFRHGDGGLALFNAGVAEESWLVDLALAQPHAKGRPLIDAPDAGFRRIQAGRSILIADMGVPSSVARWAHAGTLSFEMSTGKERLIVNCGPWRGGDASWRQALRATAAHSTLTVDDTSSASLADNGTLSNGPTKVDVERHDQEGASWLEASHDGYLQSFGLLHKRRLYASEDGADVRGEDTLMRIERRSREGREYAVRFHLHPDVQCTLVEDRSAVLLRLPSGSAWQMRASGGTIDINESIYAGDGANRRRTEQIVLTGPIQDTTTTVKWALRRIPKGN